jgi:hypothetical protein
MIYMSDGSPLITTADPADNQARLELICKAYDGRSDSAGYRARRMVEQLALAACAETTVNGQIPVHDVTNAEHRRVCALDHAHVWEQMARYEYERVVRKAQYEALRPAWIGKRVQVKRKPPRTDHHDDDTPRTYRGCRGTVLDFEDDLGASPTDLLFSVQLDNGHEDAFWLTELDVLL